MAKVIAINGEKSVIYYSVTETAQIFETSGYLVKKAIDLGIAINDVFGQPWWFDYYADPLLDLDPNERGRIGQVINGRKVLQYVKESHCYECLCLNCGTVTRQGIHHLVNTRCRKCKKKNTR